MAEYGMKGTGIPIRWDLVPEEQEEGQSPAGLDPQERKDLGVKPSQANHSTSEETNQGEEL